MSPTVGILYAPGTNSHHETAFAFDRVGGSSSFVFMADLLAGRSRLDDFDIVCLPGGFAYGDHLGGGALAGALLRERVGDQLDAIASRPVLAICNGFQVAVRSGMFGDGITLTVNDNATFQNLPFQEHVVADDADSPWLTGMEGETVTFPCAHGEGRFVAATPEGERWRAALHYPADRNPDGSAFDIAGIVSLDGLAFGLMDHPERAPDNERAMTIFANGVAAAAT